MENREQKEKKQIPHLKAIIIGAIILFFGVYFFYTLNKLGVFTSSVPKSKSVISKTVDFKQPKLHVFDETLYLNEFPDTIRMHYPYLLVVQPEARKSQIFNLETQKKEKEIMDIPLDYWQGSVLYNWHGTTTYYNKKSLDLHCDEGFIESTTEILCITAKANDPIDNKLISINPQTLLKQDIYSSQKLITAVSSLNGVLYIGETTLISKKTDIRVGDSVIQTPSSVDVIYQMNGKIYYATFQSSQINRRAAYYLVQPDTKSVVIQGSGKIVLYSQ